VPQVGINATRATIILRIVAEGESEEACRAQIEPTVAEIHRCLGTLVYGEGDDELQDVVIRMLRERGKTLSTAEVATDGQTACWLSIASGSEGPFRGGLVVAANKQAPSDDHDMSYVRALAIECRTMFQTDFALAIGRMPRRREEGAAGHVYFALASESDVRTLRVSSGIHPDILTDYLAKHAINLLRLALLGDTSPNR
jgi:nicotinamide-nucleotide amidase